MSRTVRMMSMSAAAIALGLLMAFGSVVAQDEMATEQPEPTSAGLSIRGAWTRESVAMDLAGAVYMVIRNDTDRDDALVGASSPAAGIAEIHQTITSSDGSMTMSPVAEVPVPAHASAVLEPGGYHIMLIGLLEPLVEGGLIPLTVEFATSAPLTVMVPVQATGPLGVMSIDYDMDDDWDDDMDDEDRDDDDGDDLDDDMGDDDQDDDRDDRDDDDGDDRDDDDDDD